MKLQGVRPSMAIPRHFLMEYSNLTLKHEQKARSKKRKASVKTLYTVQWSMIWPHSCYGPGLDNMLQLPDEFFVFLQPLHQNLQIKGNWMYRLNVSSCKKAVHCKHVWKCHSCGFRNSCFRLPVCLTWHWCSLIHSRANRFTPNKAPRGPTELLRLLAWQPNSQLLLPRSVKPRCFRIVRTISPVPISPSLPRTDPRVWRL